MFYMVLALATGIFYFTWVVAGVSMSFGLAVLIIGIPFVILYFGSVRVLSLVEGRIVEVMLGERMPRRPLYSERGKPLLERIKDMFTDPRTWSTQLYFLLMLPLGIVYFTFVVTGLSVSLSLIAAPVCCCSATRSVVQMDDVSDLHPAVGVANRARCGGIVLLFAVLHGVRAIGRLHGQLAKHLLVKSAQYS